MVRFTDKAREFWLQQALDHGEMPKRVAREPTVTISYPPSEDVHTLVLGEILDCYQGAVNSRPFCQWRTPMTVSITIDGYTRTFEIEAP